MNRRFWYTHTCTHESEFTVAAPDRATADEIAWAYLERTYPGDPALDIVDVEDIGVDNGRFEYDDITSNETTK